MERGSSAQLLLTLGPVLSQPAGLLIIIEILLGNGGQYCALMESGSWKAFWAVSFGAHGGSLFWFTMIVLT